MNGRKDRRRRFWAGRCNVSHRDAEVVGDEAYSTPGFRKMIHDGERRKTMVSSFEEYRREKE